MGKKQILTIFLVIFVSDAFGQHVQRQTVSGTGMQMGSVLGQTSYGHENPNFSIRLYTQRTLTGNLVGEAGLSLAMISGKDYKTRLMPLDYRFQYRFRERLFVTSTAVQPYIYAGMGVLYQQPIAVGTEDDPLTREAGTRIPSTAMFGFDGGLSPIMPLGLGASFPTGHSTNVTVNLGYNQTFSDFSFSDPSVNFGYWSLSVGLSFNRLSSRSNRPGREQPAARPPIYMNMAQLQAKPVLPLQMPGSITFALHSSELSETARGRLIEISRILKSDQTLRLRITGHTDVTGTDPLNELISQSRARATRLQLIDMGIDPERIEYSWYGDIISLADNSTKEGREQNRRVEFEMVRDAAPRAREAVAPDEKPISYEIGKPLFGRKSIAFGWLELQPVGHTEGRLMQAANLLVRDSSVSLLVVSVDDSRSWDPIKNEITKARAEWIRCWMIDHGIAPERITAVGEKDLARLEARYRSHFRNDGSQQTVLIPIVAGFAHIMEGGN